MTFLSKIVFFNCFLIKLRILLLALYITCKFCTFLTERKCTLHYNIIITILLQCIDNLYLQKAINTFNMLFIQQKKQLPKLE